MFEIWERKKNNPEPLSLDFFWNIFFAKKNNIQLNAPPTQLYTGQMKEKPNARSTGYYFVHHVHVRVVVAISLN